MSIRAHATLGLFILCGVAALPGAASAGPCSAQIAELGRKLAQSPSLGPPTTGTLTGSNPGSIATGASSPGAPPTSGTSAGDHVGGLAGTREANAAVGNLVATSSQDVRRQQEGLPTAAAVASADSGKAGGTARGSGASSMPNDRMSEAKMELKRATMLDHKNDSSCKQAISRTQQLMK